MRKTSITRRDILEALRSEKGLTSMDAVEDAYLERSGKVSVIKKGEDSSSDGDQVKSRFEEKG
jgi:uncharacterized membrane protein YcaP (DUF421 family)